MKNTIARNEIAQAVATFAENLENSMDMADRRDSVK
jgi:hypothetical protein